VHEQERRELIKQAFEARGLSVAEWSRARGYNAPLVYAVLAGRVHARRGKAHQIAVALGIKQTPEPAVEWLEKVFSATPNIPLAVASAVEATM